MGVFLEYVDLRSINMHYRSLQINSQKRDCLHGHIVQEQWLNTHYQSTALQDASLIYGVRGRTRGDYSNGKKMQCTTQFVQGRRECVCFLKGDNCTHSL